jgi:hypothetical protein
MCFSWTGKIRIRSVKSVFDPIFSYRVPAIRLPVAGQPYAESRRFAMALQRKTSNGSPIPISGIGVVVMTMRDGIPEEFGVTR